MNEQLTAHYLANRYPGKIIITFDCGHEGKKIKHHPDYKKPLEIELLCMKCHWGKKDHHHKGIFCINMQRKFSRSECAGYRYLKYPKCLGCSQKDYGIFKKKLAEPLDRRQSNQ